MITEAEMIKHFRRMVSIYLESYPKDQESVERFQRWLLHSWGYEDGQS